ncbi:DMT family transporter [Ferruginibacter albus]|uniref:DMT family transporter n=1 Tax=Ferruginibacter albus TaxID=2875540 RepID=UPI001CC33FA2|nr:DMT family transporter [Ferruginibacter albus]UAY52827.1 DMT family transporter [Ferruginibacter albus]
MKTEQRNKGFAGGFIIAFIGALLFSTKAILVKLAFAHTGADAVTLLALRMLFALPFYILTAVFVKPRSSAKKITTKQLVYVIALGLAGYYLSSLFDFIGLQYVSAGMERLILFLYPTFAVLLNARLFKQSISRNQKLALMLTYAGILIAYVGELKNTVVGEHFYWGSFLIFICAVTFSVYIAGSGRLIPQMGATRFTSYAMIAAAVGVIAHYFITGNKVHAISQTLLWYSIALAIVATVIPSFFYSLGIKRIGANNVAIVTSIGPISTILQADLILGEKVFIGQIIGTALVVIGVLLIGWKKSDTVDE